jgi:hypothetical protein
MGFIDEGYRLCYEIEFVRSIYSLLIVFKDFGIRSNNSVCRLLTSE